jgi:hypothetical protein
MRPDSASRVRDIRDKAQELRCSKEVSDQFEWRELQASLPGPPEDTGSDTTNGTDK